MKRDNLIRKNNGMKKMTTITKNLPNSDFNKPKNKPASKLM